MSRIAQCLATIIGMGLVAPPTHLWLEQKQVLVNGYSTENVWVGSENPFDYALLHELAVGKDIVPGFPEQGAMCAKTMRALTNTLLGEPYFTRSRFVSKVQYAVEGRETLAADKNGIYGDAWEMYYNIQEAGGELLYEAADPFEQRRQSIDFIVENAKIGDIIGFYYPDSKYNNVARDAGPGFTHMGLVIGYAHEDEKVVPLIAHLFHSDQYTIPFPETKMQHAKKEFLSQLYRVDHTTVPALRVETITTIDKQLLFSGYQLQIDMHARTEPEYSGGDPLIYVKAVLRLNYKTKE